MEPGSTTGRFRNTEAANGLLMVSPTAIYAMLLLAAFIEAFWSSMGWMPAAAKYTVAAVLWSVVGLWLWRGGRDRDAC